MLVQGTRVAVLPPSGATDGASTGSALCDRNAQAQRCRRTSWHPPGLPPPRVYPSALAEVPRRSPGTPSVETPTAAHEAPGTAAASPRRPAGRRRARGRERRRRRLRGALSEPPRRPSNRRRSSRTSCLSATPGARPWRPGGRFGRSLKRSVRQPAGQSISQSGPSGRMISWPEQTRGAGSIPEGGTRGASPIPGTAFPPCSHRLPRRREPRAIPSIVVSPSL